MSGFVKSIVKLDKKKNKILKNKEIKINKEKQEILFLLNYFHNQKILDPKYYLISLLNNKKYKYDENYYANLLLPFFILELFIGGASILCTMAFFLNGTSPYIFLVYLLHLPLLSILLYKNFSKHRNIMLENKIHTIRYIDWKPQKSLEDKLDEENNKLDNEIFKLESK